MRANSISVVCVVFSQFLGDGLQRVKRGIEFDKVQGRCGQLRVGPLGFPRVGFRADCSVVASKSEP